MSTYEREGDWSGYVVRRTAKGWIVDSWSAVQGCNTDSKVLIKPTQEVPHDADLEAPWNDWMDIGQYIAECLAERPSKVIARGYAVE